MDGREELKQNTTSQTNLETLQTSTIKARNAEQNSGIDVHSKHLWPPNLSRAKHQNA